MKDELKKLYIEPTSKCNLACTMCFRNTWIDEPLADMDIAVFDKAFDTMPDSVETMFFGGMGEPLSHKDIIYMVKKASLKCANVELLTNGTLLSKEMSAALLDAGLTKLWISIDSLDAVGYAEIRKNSDFGLITKNIKQFNIERSRRDYRDGFAKLGITFVAMKSNVAMLTNLSKFAWDYNVNEVNISNAIPTDAASQDESLFNRVVNCDLGADKAFNAYPVINLPYMDYKLPEVREGMAGLLKDDCNLIIGGVPLARRKGYCRFVEENVTFVRHDGDVSPCMALLHSAETFLEGDKRIVYHHSFGNVKDAGLSIIFDSEEYADFRARVREFSFSPCIHCGGCENRETNEIDCVGNLIPTCGACLWSEGIISCP